MVFDHGVHDVLRGHVSAQVNDVVTVVFQQHAHDVLANVVDVAVDSADHDLALCGHGFCALGTLAGGADGLEARLGGLGCGHELRQEERALLKSNAHLVKGRDQDLGDGVHHVVIGQHARDDLGHGALTTGQDQLAGLFLGGRGGAGGGRGLLACCLGRQGSRHGHAVLAVAVYLDVVTRAIVLARKHAPRVDDVHHARHQRVHDGQVKARREGSRQESRVDKGPKGQAKANVGKAQDGAHARQLALDARDGGQNLARGLLIGRAGHAQAIDDHVVARDANSVGCRHDLLGHGNAALGGGGDAVLVKRKAHDGTAVMLGHGQDLGQDLVLAVGRVDKGLTGIAAHGRLDDLRICRVDLQRQRGHALQLGHKLNHGGALVDLGQAHVNVQDLRAGVGLRDGLAHDVVVVALAQGLLHLLLARGVDALANDAHLAHLQSADALGAGHAEPVARGRLARFAIGEKGALARDVGGRGAAAAAHDGDAQVEHLGHGLAVLGHMDVEDRLAVHNARQARVCLDHHGALCPGNHALYQRQEVVGAQRAVDAHGVGAHRREGHRGHLGRGAQEGAAVLGKGHGHKDGQVGVLLHGEKCGLGLGQVGHGLDDKEVGARRGGRLGLLGKEVVGVVEGQGAHGLQELAGGADVCGHVAGARLARAGDGGLEDLLDRGGVAQLVAVGAKGVGGGDVCAGGHVGGVDVGDLCGVGEAQ